MIQSKKERQNHRKEYKGKIINMNQNHRKKNKEKKNPEEI